MLAAASVYLRGMGHQLDDDVTRLEQRACITVPASLAGAERIEIEIEIEIDGEVVAVTPD